MSDPAFTIVAVAWVGFIGCVVTLACVCLGLLWRTAHRWFGEALDGIAAEMR